MSSFACPQKICTYCNILKPITQFNKQQHGKFGVKSRCKICCIKLLEKYDKECKYCKIKFKGRKKTIYCGNPCKRNDYKNCGVRNFKLSLGKIAEKNPMWKGNKVGYYALHEWVKNRLVKPSLCSRCHTEPPYDLANISQLYKRDLSDWEYLCRKCHMIKDGRLLNLIHYV